MNWRRAGKLFGLAVAAVLLAAPVQRSGAQETGQDQADQRQVEAAAAALKPQRPGIVDAYVVVVALDSDPVFNREAREAGRVLANRFDAVGRTIVLAKDEGADRGNAPGSPNTLTLALARVAARIDPNEDVLVLYSTSHGQPGAGLMYRDGRGGGMLISPGALATILRPLGIKNKLLILQACFSGQFVHALKDPNTIVVTAAAENRSSFGCAAGNDWTYFGDALINHTMRQPLTLDTQVRRAEVLIAAAESRDNLEPSNPQFNIGADSDKWLNKLEEREPRTASNPVGQSVLGLGK